MTTFNTVVDVVAGNVVDVFAGAVVEVVEVVEDEVVVLEDEVVVVVEEVVVVGTGGVTPLNSPPTVLPALGPPKIEDSDRPAASSMSVTTPSAITKAASAEPVAITDIRHRL